MPRSGRGAQVDFLSAGGPSIDTPSRPPPRCAGVGAETALFGLLDAAVGADTGPSGLRGSLGVGVITAKGLRWWLGTFADENSYELTAGKAPNCDAAIIIGATELAQMLGGQTPNLGAQFQTFGDYNLIERFCTRYLKRKTGFDLYMFAKAKG